MKLEKILLTINMINKYITTPEFNKLTAKNLAARLAQANLIAKTDFDAKLSSLNGNITSNKTRHLLAKNKFKKFKTFDLSYFRRKSRFEEDGTQNYLVFQSTLEYFKTVSANDSNIIK